MFLKFFLLLCSVSFLVKAQETQSNQCASLANCLTDVANRLEKCTNDFRDLMSTANKTDQCQQETTTKWFNLMDLQARRGREVANCLKVLGPNTAEAANAQCPTASAPNKKSSNLRKRRQAQTDGATLQTAIAKVQRECKNAQSIFTYVKGKADSKTLYSRQQVVEYVSKNCDGKSTLAVNDLPAFIDVKLEKAIWKVQKNCKNSDEIIKNVQTKQQAKEFYSRQQLVTYVNQNCQGGTANLSVDDIPDFGIFNNPFFKKLEQANVKIQKECKNSDAILKDLKNMFNQKRLNNSQEVVDIVKQRCDGKSTLTTDDLPAIGCDKDVQNRLKICLEMVKQCPTAGICNECYETSPTHNLIHQTQLDLIQLKAKCAKTAPAQGDVQRDTQDPWPTS